MNNTTTNLPSLATVLSAIWKKRDGSTDIDMVNWCIKESKIVNMGDYWLDIGSAKPKIESTLWYDDETQGPDANLFEEFREYNLRGKAATLDEITKRFGSDGKIWIYKNKYTRDNRNILRGWTTSDTYHGKPTHVGECYEATEEERAAIAQGLQEIRNNYEKRLKTYWKRYSDKVYARGYWANR